MRPFFYHRATSLEEAGALINASSRPLAGGTDLLTLMKADIFAPEHVVAISAVLPRGIAHHAAGLSIGAGTLLSEIESHPDIAQRYAALAQAARLVASAQLRNMATVGGNLLQRPRCWYFRHPHVQCWRKGGTLCQARDGENREHALFGGGACVATHPSDLAPALLAFDATVTVRGARGERPLPLGEFFTMPTEAHRSETVLRDDELVLGLELPAHPEETHSVYLKAMDREAFAFALAGVAAVLRVSAKGRVGHARLVLSGVAQIPWRAMAAETLLLGEELTPARIDEAAAAALEGAAPLAKNRFKIPLAKELVRRALRRFAAL